MNMKEVQLLGILAVIAGGIIVLSLWGSQPNSQQNEPKPPPEQSAAERDTTNRGSRTAQVEDWEWLTQKRNNQGDDAKSNSTTTEPNSTSSPNGQKTEESQANTGIGNANNDSGSDRRGGNSSVVDAIDDTPPAQIGMQPEKKDKSAEKEPEQEKAPRIHEVQKGETFVAISQEYYGTRGKWRKIFKANRDVVSSPKKLRPGMELVIPSTADSQSASRGDNAQKPLLSANKKDGNEVYTVQKGDTLWSLARKHYGDGAKRRKILDANDNLHDPRKLRAGMKIVIPE